MESHHWSTIAYDFPGGAVVKHPPANAGDRGSIPELGRSPGVGNGNPLQYSCLENSMNREIHGVAKTQTQLNMHTHTAIYVTLTNSVIGIFTSLFQSDLCITKLWTSLVAQMIKNMAVMWETRVQSLGQGDPLEKGMATFHPHRGTLPCFPDFLIQPPPGMPVEEKLCLVLSILRCGTERCDFLSSWLKAGLANSFFFFS